MTDHIDARLEQAMQHGKYRVTLNRQKENNKLRYKQALIFPINGGIFNTDPAFIAFVYALVDRGTEQAVLVDVNGNPTAIENLPDFLDDCIDAYHQASNSLLVDHKKLQNARSITPMLDL